MIATQFHRVSRWPTVAEIVGHGGVPTPAQISGTAMTRPDAVPPPLTLANAAEAGQQRRLPGRRFCPKGRFGVFGHIRDVTILTRESP
jgi:hypothetical protein